MQTNKSELRSELIIGSVLLLVLALTRSGITRSHFGTEFNLPDASWALFWLTGALTVKRIWPALLMLASVAIDYFVIAGGVSDYCFTPAYPFLMPAYLSLWAAGRWMQRVTGNMTYVLRSAVSVFIGVSACFIIANIGFFVASGYFAQLQVLQYAQAVSGYWPYYLLHTAIYAGAGLLIRFVITHLKTAYNRTTDTN